MLAGLLKVFLERLAFFLVGYGKAQLDATRKNLRISEAQRKVKRINSDDELNRSLLDGKF